MTTVTNGNDSDQPRLLRAISAAAGRELLRGAENCRVTAGESLEEENGAAIGFVLSGVARIYLTEVSGRQQTIRYVQSGDFIGAARLLGSQERVEVEAVTPVRWVRLRPPVVGQLLRTDPEVARAIARELLDEHDVAVQQLRQASFLHIRSRLVAHLLLRAEVEGDVLHVTQRDLANMVGSVREVVGRVLQDMERAGAVRRRGSGVIEVERDALLALAQQR